MTKLRKRRSFWVEAPVIHSHEPSSNAAGRWSQRHRSPKAQPGRQRSSTGTRWHSQGQPPGQKGQPRGLAAGALPPEALSDGGVRQPLLTPSPASPHFVFACFHSSLSESISFVYVITRLFCVLSLAVSSVRVETSVCPVFHYMPST